MILVDKASIDVAAGVKTCIFAQIYVFEVCLLGGQIAEHSLI